MSDHPYLDFDIYDLPNEPLDPYFARGQLETTVTLTRNELVVLRSNALMSAKHAYSHTTHNADNPQHPCHASYRFALALVRKFDQALRDIDDVPDIDP